MKKNVLIFPCGTEVGLELHKSLNFSTHFNLIGGSSSDDHGKFVYSNYVDNIPFVNDSGFINAINEIIDTHKVDYIFPAHDSVVLELARAQSKGLLRCNVITSPLETCEITRSKKRTYEYLSDSLAVPILYDSEDVQENNYPLFLKPDVGQGSKGTFKINNKAELDFYVSENKDSLILDYLPGDEFTVDCFTDFDGQLRFSKGRRRERITNGISVRSTYYDDDNFTKLANIINEKMVFNGVWFFQVKKDTNNKYVLMEISPRIAGTMGLTRSKGVNLAILSLFNEMGYSTEITENNYDIIVDRALHNRYVHNISYDHLYIDYDDLIVFGGRVNPMVMSFIYQSINEGIKVHLITKHKGNLNESLNKYRLNDLFDEIILLAEDDYKYKYITESSAIFIDDSFEERKQVYEMCKIPVFDYHMIEGLIRKFE